MPVVPPAIAENETIAPAPRPWPTSVTRSVASMKFTALPPSQTAVPVARVFVAAKTCTPSASFESGLPTMCRKVSVEVPLPLAAPPRTVAVEFCTGEAVLPRVPITSGSVAPAGGAAPAFTAAVALVYTFSSHVTWKSMFCAGVNAVVDVGGVWESIVGAVRSIVTIRVLLAAPGVTPSVERTLTEYGPSLRIAPAGTVNVTLPAA